MAENSTQLKARPNNMAYSLLTIPLYSVTHALRHISSPHNADNNNNPPLR